MIQHLNIQLKTQLSRRNRKININKFIDISPFNSQLYKKNLNF